MGELALQRMEIKMMNEQIRLLLRNRRISQVAVAREIGCHRISVNRYLNGRTELNSEQFVKLVRFIGGEVRLPEIDWGSDEIPTD